MTEPCAASVDEVLEQHGVARDTGLDERTVKERRRRFGPNQLREVTRASTWRLLIEQFQSLIMLILALASAASFFMGELAQGIAIAAAVVINAGIGFVTELRAVRSMEALRRLDVAKAQVRRNGEVSEIAARDLVPGDLVLLEAGDLVPADLRLIEARNLYCDESALTGESLPVAKTTERLDAATPLAERANMAFKGTSVTRGSALAVAVATGMQTELGRISALAEEAQAESTPLEKRLDELGRQLVLITLVVAAAITALGIATGRDLVLMIETGVALVVAAAPEGLPVVASIALARGMWRMARRNALIERLSAVETLGATSIICTDKTGTLTENRMTVSRLALAGGEVDLEADAGQKDASVVRRALEVGALCNTAELGDGHARARGDPMEIALREAARALGLEHAFLVAAAPEVRREEFDQATRMMASVHRADGTFRFAVKGAPEAVLEVCGRVRTEKGEETLDEAAKKDWLERNRALAGKGLRALAVAEKTAADEGEEAYRDLTLLGLVGLVDPPREDAAAAVRACRAAGIKVVMVTGDQPATARAIAAAAGLTDDDEPDAITGRELQRPDEMGEEARRRALAAPIFCRVDPQQKLDLIDLYQRTGAVVAMTGDGVNDAPALKKADIGVAMGRRGTQVAREAADMVLLDDAFASITAAIEQGRVIFRNIRRFIVYLLSGNAGEILAVALASIVAAPLPLLPLQILFINIISDVFPALALGVGEQRGDVMNRPPRPSDEPILTRAGWLAIGGYGVLIAASVLTVFGLALAWLQLEARDAVTISFLAFAFARLLHVFNMRDVGSHPLINDVTANPFVWGALGIGVLLIAGGLFVPLLADLLQITPPSPAGWGLIAAGAIAPLVVGQLLKLRLLWSTAAGQPAPAAGRA